MDGGEEKCTHGFSGKGWTGLIRLRIRRSGKLLLSG